MDNIETLRKEKDELLAEWQIYHTTCGKCVKCNKFRIDHDDETCEFETYKIPDMEKLAKLRAKIRHIERDNV